MDLPPGQERTAAYRQSEASLETLAADLWGQVQELGAAELQLSLFINNAWLSLPHASAGFLINYRRYAEARGKDAKRIGKKNVSEREKFNAAIHRLASLDVQADVTRFRGRKRERVHQIRGRMLMAEAVGGSYEGPLPGLDGPRRAEVTVWRLIPGTAWLASRHLGQIGRFPRILLTLDPHNQELLIRLGIYLGRQEAVRATNGTLAQPLSIRAILGGVKEPVPTDRRAVHRLKARLEKALDDLQALGVLEGWHWVFEGRPGAAFLDDAIQFAYHWDSVEDLAAHHPRGKKALASPAMQELLTSDGWGVASGGQ